MPLLPRRNQVRHRRRVPAQRGLRHLRLPAEPDPSLPPQGLPALPRWIAESTGAPTPVRMPVSTLSGRIASVPVQQRLRSFIAVV